MEIILKDYEKQLDNKEITEEEFKEIIKKEKDNFVENTGNYETQWF